MASGAQDRPLGPGLWAVILGLACVCCLLLLWLGLHVAARLSEAEDMHQKNDKIQRLKIQEERRR
jgi:hypothetical protein